MQGDLRLCYSLINKVRISYVVFCFILYADRSVCQFQLWTNKEKKIKDKASSLLKNIFYHRSSIDDRWSLQCRTKSAFVRECYSILSLSLVLLSNGIVVPTFSCHSFNNKNHLIFVLTHTRTVQRRVIGSPNTYSSCSHIFNFKERKKKKSEGKEIGTHNVWPLFFFSFILDDAKIMIVSIINTYSLVCIFFFLKYSQQSVYLICREKYINTYWMFYMQCRKRKKHGEERKVLITVDWEMKTLE
jgi:hypothetical protein